MRRGRRLLLLLISLLVGRRVQHPRWQRLMLGLLGVCVVGVDGWRQLVVSFLVVMALDLALALVRLEVRLQVWRSLTLDRRMGSSSSSSTCRKWMARLVMVQMVQRRGV